MGPSNFRCEAALGAPPDLTLEEDGFSPQLQHGSVTEGHNTCTMNVRQSGRTLLLEHNKNRCRGPRLPTRFCLLTIVVSLLWQMCPSDGAAVPVANHTSPVADNHWSTQFILSVTVLVVLVLMARRKRKNAAGSTAIAAVLGDKASVSDLEITSEFQTATEWSDWKERVIAHATLASNTNATNIASLMTEDGNSAFDHDDASMVDRSHRLFTFLSGIVKAGRALLIIHQVRVEFNEMGHVCWAMLCETYDDFFREAFSEIHKAWYDRPDGSTMQLTNWVAKLYETAQHVAKATEGLNVKGACFPTTTPPV
mmetsp:Transcript_12182/g.36664  ORF Transcript_12182/g.36664 Transcript_12182/m.36664 type:complete len:310 (+) Transcript_12182:14-943(+)